MARSSLLVLLALSGCALVERRLDCPLDEAMAASRYVVDLELVDDEGTGCFEGYTTTTLTPGSLALAGCEEVEDPVALECGYALHLRCPGPVLDAVGTRAELEITGELGWSLRKGAHGEATINWVHPAGWELCSGTYRVEAWPFEP